jgi:hypothetical protein
MTLGTLSTLVATTLGLLSLIGGGIAYIRASTKKAYAAERDMNHFKNNQVQLARNIDYYREQTDEKLQSIHDELIEIKAKIEYSKHN